MTTEAGASTGSGWPNVLIYTVALASGLFLALAVHVGLTVAGVGLTGASRAGFFSSKDQINIAMAWWAIGIAGCFGSLAAILLTRQLNRRGLRMVSIAVGLAFFCLLAAAGRKAGAPPGTGAAANVVLNLAAMTLGGFMAFFAAHFAARR